jgi:hypothetical protein
MMKINNSRAKWNWLMNDEWGWHFYLSIVTSGSTEGVLHSIKCPLRHDPMKNTIFQCNFCLFCSFFLWSFVNAILRHWQGTHDNKLIIEYFFLLYLKESVGEWKFCVRINRRNQLNLMTWKWNEKNVTKICCDEEPLQ